RDPGRDRLAHHRAQLGEGAAQERDREMLWWRREPQAQAAGEAEGGQAPHEAGRQRRDSAGGVPRRPAGRPQVGLGVGMHFDFSAALVLGAFVTGIIWAVDALAFAPRRRAMATPTREPLIVDYARSFFPLILIVLVLRSFVGEPFRIPSG